MVSRRAVPLGGGVVEVVGIALPVWIGPHGVFRVHPCRCGRCGDSGTECAWRAKIVKHMVTGALAGIAFKKKGTLADMQVMEMQGREGPDNLRRPLLINLFALLLEAHPLETLLLGGISQHPPIDDMFSDGVIKT